MKKIFKYSLLFTLMLSGCFSGGSNEPIIDESLLKKVERKMHELVRKNYKLFCGI